MLNAGEKTPEYMPAELEELTLNEQISRPPKAKWVKQYIGKGKKDKLNKIDIAGFLYKKGNLSREDVGSIDVKENYAFVAIKRGKIKQLLNLIQGEKIKGMRILRHTILQNRYLKD